MNSIRHFVTGLVLCLTMCVIPGSHAADGVDVCFTDVEIEVAPVVKGAAGVGASGGLPRGVAVPVANVPVYNSRPGSGSALYLDFNGMILTGTVWNAAAGGEAEGSYEVSNPCIPFDMDGDRTTFNDAEQLVIQQIWKRVAEAYSPWDINVTTVEPVSGLWSTLLFTSGKDANGVNNPYYPGALGVAQTLSFGFSAKQPSFCYYNSANSAANEHVMANIANHELGHTFGLKHDAGQGQAVNDYYPGHAGTSDLTSWVPIMGECVQSSKAVVQFSKGDYTGYVGNPAQGQMDDLLKVDLSVLRRPDDHSNTVATATTLAVSQDGTLSSAGIITDALDVDAIRFTNAVAGSATFTVLPLTDPLMPGCATLDVRMDLYRASDNALMATANPQGDTAATIVSVNLEAGVDYVLMVRGDSEGNPFATPPVGYTSYGSLGQWFMTGALPTPSVHNNSSTYQQGVGGYLGTVDVSLDNNIAAWNNNNGASNVTNGNRTCSSDANGPSKVYLLKFTGLGLEGARVTSATLDLTFVNWAGAPALTGTYLSRAWNSAGANAPTYGFGWSNCAIGQAWGTPGAAGSGTDYLAGLSFSVPVLNSSGQQARSLVLSPAVVQSWIDAPVSNQGIRLVQSTPSLSTTVCGSDNVTVGLRPKLTIDYTVSAPPTPTFAGGALSSSPDGATISFATVAGYRYRLVFTDGLTNPLSAWTPVVPPAPDGWSNASGPVMSIMDTNAVAVPYRFYRIQAASP